MLVTKSFDHNHTGGGGGGWNCQNQSGTSQGQAGGEGWQAAGGTFQNTLKVCSRPGLTRRAGDVYQEMCHHWLQSKGHHLSSSPSLSQASTGPASCPPPPQTQARPAPDASLPPSHSTHLPVCPWPGAQPCPPSRLSHPAWLPPAPILGSQTLANTHTCSHTLTLTCTRVHGHSPTGRWQLTLWPRQVPRAGTTCRRSGKQASRKQSGSGFGGWSRKEGISCKR